MLGPRNSVVRLLRGEEVTSEDWVTDQSEFIDSRWLYFNELPELWIDKIHDYVHEGDF